jgi:Plasmid pRiA4b ORF-3-like protein
MGRTWLSVRVDLVEGHGHHYWPRPGRIFAAARTHTFAQLADAIDDAFARWDRCHLHQFLLADGTQRVGRPDWEDEDDDDLLDGRRLTLGRLGAGEQFVYEFDLGDRWMHLCTVADRRVDPLDQLGIVPDRPLPYWGWGDIPDQYGRRWDGDDGEAPPPPDPALRDLPPLQPWWGSRHALTLRG